MIILSPRLHRQTTDTLISSHWCSVTIKKRIEACQCLDQRQVISRRYATCCDTEVVDVYRSIIAIASFNTHFVRSLVNQYVPAMASPHSSFKSGCLTTYWQHIVPQPTIYSSSIPHSSFPCPKTQCSHLFILPNIWKKTIVIQKCYLLRKSYYS